MAITHPTHKMQFKTITFLFLQTFQTYTKKYIKKEKLWTVKHPFILLLCVDCLQKMHVQSYVVCVYVCNIHET